jgi:hypothetical protein
VISALSLHSGQMSANRSSVPSHSSGRSL